MPAEFDDSFDQELVAWFAQRRGVWSGTAAELLAAVRTGRDVEEGSWPQSPGTLYAHLESHRQILRSLGVDVALRQGPPRMLSLRSCAAEESSGKSSDPSTSLLQLVDDPKKGETGSGDSSPKATETVSQNIPVALPDWAARFVSERYAEKDDTAGRVFQNTREALLAVEEMRAEIMKQGLDLKPAIDLMISQSQEATRSCGAVVGLLQQDTVVYPVRAGAAASMAGLDLHANFFQSCIRTGEALQLLDAQRHPLLGATCRLEGIGSLVIVPVFHDREVAAAVEFFFQEMRSFSTGFIMDLELIAGVLSELLAGASKAGLNPPEERGGLVTRTAVEDTQAQGHSLDDKAGLVNAFPISVLDTARATASLTRSATPESVLSLLASKLVTASTRLGLALKRVWINLL